MVTVYRTGSLPELSKVANRNAVWFDALAPVPEGCSPRSSSVFASLSHEEAAGWVDWRLDAGLDASIYRITLPDDYPIYIHPVSKYEESRLVQTLAGLEGYGVAFSEEESAASYWQDRVQVVDGLTAPFGGFWEVLIPHSLAETADWELVEYVSDNYRETVPSYFD